MNLFERNAKKIVILAVLAGSTSGIFGRMITAGSLAVGFYRLSFALPFFIIPIFLKHREQLLKLRAKDYMWCGIAGFFLFAHFFSWFTAIKSTTIASAVILAALHPLVVLLVTVLVFKQHVEKKAVLGILVALAGGGIVAGSDYSFSGGAVYGNLMAIGAAVFMGLYFCVGQVMRVKIPPGTYVMLVFSGCWICFMVGMLATGTAFAGYPAMDYVWLACMALVCQIGAHAGFNWCFGYVPPLYVSAWATADACFATILAAIVFSEIPNLWRCLGGGIAIAGLLYYNVNEGKKSI